jgi:hypothetical protein
LEANRSIIQKSAQAKGISVNNDFQGSTSSKMTPQARNAFRIKSIVKNTKGLMIQRLILKDDTASPSFYMIKRHFSNRTKQHQDKLIP